MAKIACDMGEVALLSVHSQVSGRGTSKRKPNTADRESSDFAANQGLKHFHNINGSVIFVVWANKSPPVTSKVLFVCLFVCFQIETIYGWPWVRAALPPPGGACHSQNSGGGRAQDLQGVCCSPCQGKINKKLKLDLRFWLHLQERHKLSAEEDCPSLGKCLVKLHGGFFMWRGGEGLIAAGRAAARSVAMAKSKPRLQARQVLNAVYTWACLYASLPFLLPAQ